MSGEVYGFSLVYSGNFLAQAEVDTYDVTRVTSNSSGPVFLGDEKRRRVSDTGGGDGLF